MCFGAAAEMPDFSVPEAEANHNGDLADKTDQVSHRKHLAQLELQAQVKKVSPPRYNTTAHIIKLLTT